MTSLGSSFEELVARFKKNERFRREVEDAVEWLSLFFILSVLVWLFN
jgi:hypothetical protein